MRELLRDNAWFNDQSQRGALLFLNDHFCKVRDANDINPVISKIAPCNGSRLDRLIDRPSANCLYFRPFMFTYYPCNCPGNCR